MTAVSRRDGPTQRGASAGSVAVERLTMSTKWLSPYVVRITAVGGIDAASATDFARYVFRYAANSRRLILDLSGVEFFDTAGLSALTTIDRRCAQATVNWMVVASRAVSLAIEVAGLPKQLPIARS